MGTRSWFRVLTTGTVTLRPGACLGVMTGQADATGYAVIAGTGDLPTIAALAGVIGAGSGLFALIAR